MEGVLNLHDAGVCRGRFLKFASFEGPMILRVGVDVYSHPKMGTMAVPIGSMGHYGTIPVYFHLHEWA